MKKLLNVAIETSEDLVTIHIEVDKEKFKSVIAPLLLINIKHLATTT